MENTKHWAESLISGDRCLATIRHQTDGSKNKHNVNVIVVRNKIEINSILCTEEGSGVSIIIPYYELSQIPQPKQEKIEEVVKDLNYCKNNAEEDYLQVPISVLRYISELEKHQSEKMFIKVKNSELLLPVTDKNYLNVIDLYGKKYNIEPVCGTNPKLKLLDKNQSVVYGDGETYHFLLTEK